MESNKFSTSQPQLGSQKPKAIFAVDISNHLYPLNMQWRATNFLLPNSRWAAKSPSCFYCGYKINMSIHSTCGGEHTKNFKSQSLRDSQNPVLLSGGYKSMTDPKRVREINLHYYPPKQVQLLPELAAELAVYPHHAFRTSSPAA